MVLVRFISKEADYILALKGNQEHLLNDVQEAFEQDKAVSSSMELDMGHGRVEKRTCHVIGDTSWVCKAEQDGKVCKV